MHAGLRHPHLRSKVAADLLQRWRLEPDETYW
jgi:hypothetical protein